MQIFSQRLAPSHGQTGNVEQSDIDRKKQLAEVMKMMSMQQNPQFQAGGNAIVAALAPIMQALAAKKTAASAKTDQEKLTGQQDADFQRVIQAFQGTPEVPPSGAIGAEGSMGTPAVPGGREAMVQALLGAQDPKLKMAGLTQMLQKPDAKWEPTDGPRGSRIIRNSVTGEEKQVISPEATQKTPDWAQPGYIDAQIRIAEARNGSSKPPSGYRMKPDGSMEAIPGGPADAKTQAKLAGGQTVSDVTASLRDMYNQLDEAGGITSTKKDAVGNILAGTASSGFGQAAGRLLGTKNQSLRNTIEQQRPLLLQAIMKATGMSAKQMDSNAELRLYLATATDPTFDVQTNKRALDMIEKLYGTGEKQPEGDAPKPPITVDW